MYKMLWIVLIKIKGPFGIFNKILLLEFGKNYVNIYSQEKINYYLLPISWSTVLQLEL